MQDPTTSFSPTLPFHQPAALQQISIVIPVYRGERSLTPLIEEIVPLAQPGRSPGGHPFAVHEVILVHDGAVDDSGRVMEALAERYPFVRPVWLSRNFGQHPATLAGMASTTGDWVATLDEDGQQDPQDIGRLLDRALAAGAQLVYAHPVNPPPHGWLRNALSSLTKWIFIHTLGQGELGRFNSFRLIQGEIARSVAAYAGPNIYLDVALSWMVARTGHCDLHVRAGCERRSGYTFASLVRHFLRLLLTSGTRPLRFISLLGLASISLSLAISGYALWKKLNAQVAVEGWTSLIIVICFFSGCILSSLGVIAEYLGATLTMTMGKPLYVVVSRPPRSREVSRRRNAA